MNNPSKVCAIIPARGESKGLPGKNLRLLAGKPLIAYSIEAGLKCNRVSRVLVSTEDPEIKRISLKYGAEVIDRPVELATDNALTRDVVTHVLDLLRSRKELPACFVLLQPTSPLRNSLHLQSCIDLFSSSQVPCIVSVTEAEHHPYKDFKVESGLLRPLFDKSFLDMPRQQLPLVYRQNGAIYIMKTEVFLRAKSFYVEPTLPFLMSKEESIDIDTEFDFLLANNILNQRFKK